MTGKTAIVGDGESITVFKAAGVAAFAAEDSKKAREIVRKIAKDYAVIFITENLYKELGDFLKRFDEAPYPVVLCIPSKDGATGYGDEVIKDAMIRALGVDILFHND
ncbi:MAG: V-type ATP synthase subunit F [Clostridia bacterium]|nr:V-type ATP synthase subunit F [Clostridia bacterium]